MVDRALIISARVCAHVHVCVHVHVYACMCMCVRARACLCGQDVEHRDMSYV